MTSSAKKSLPVRFEETEKKRIGGVISARGHKWQWLIENFLRWYERTGRVPWLEDGGTVNQTAHLPVLPPAGDTPTDPEDVELLTSLTTLKRRNPILAQALVLAVKAGAREGSEQYDASVRAARQAADEAVRNVYRTLEQIGANPTGQAESKPSGGGRTSSTTGTSEAVKKPKAG